MLQIWVSRQPSSTSVVNAENVKLLAEVKSLKDQMAEMHKLLWAIDGKMGETIGLKWWFVYKYI